MVGLLDIADIKGSVTIRGVEVDVVGMSAQDIAKLMNLVPEIRMVMSGRRPAGFSETDLAESLLAQAPDVVATVLAAALGKIDDEATIAAAGKLMVGEQFDILFKCVELTFPQGLKSFLDRMRGLKEAAQGPSVARPAKPAATKSPEPSATSSDGTTSPPSGE